MVLVWHFGVAAMCVIEKVPTPAPAMPASLGMLGGAKVQLAWSNILSLL